MSATENIAVEVITIEPRLRSIDEASIGRLMESIREIGLRTPITVRSSGKDTILVAGAHRLEAVKRLGWTRIEAFVVENWNELEARRWEIAENLHRADLTALQRDEQVAEWIRLTDEILAQHAPVSERIGGRGNEGGLRRAAREIGVERTQAQRAVKVAGLTAAAKKVAVEEGLQNNRRAMLVAAREDDAEKQADVLRNWNKPASPSSAGSYRASRIESDVKDRAAKECAEIIAEYVPSGAWDGLKANLYAAGASAIANALTNLTGQSIMDRRYGEVA